MHLPWEIDSKTNIGNPFNFENWAKMVGKDGKAVSLFSGENQMQVLLCSNGDFEFGENNGIFQWIYQIVRTYFEIKILILKIKLGWKFAGRQWSRINHFRLDLISNRSEIKVQSEWTSVGSQPRT